MQDLDMQEESDAVESTDLPYLNTEERIIQRTIYDTFDDNMKRRELLHQCYILEFHYQ